MELLKQIMISVQNINEEQQEQLMEKIKSNNICFGVYGSGEDYLELLISISDYKAIKKIIGE